MRGGRELTLFVFWFVTASSAILACYPPIWFLSGSIAELAGYCCSIVCTNKQPGAVTIFARVVGYVKSASSLARLARGAKSRWVVTHDDDCENELYWYQRKSCSGS